MPDYPIPMNWMTVPQVEPVMPAEVTPEIPPVPDVPAIPGRPDFLAGKAARFNLRPTEILRPSSDDPPDVWLKPGHFTIMSARYTTTDPGSWYSIPNRYSTAAALSHGIRLYTVSFKDLFGNDFKSEMTEKIKNGQELEIWFYPTHPKSGVDLRVKGEIGNVVIHTLTAAQKASSGGGWDDYIEFTLNNTGYYHGIEDTLIPWSRIDNRGVGHEVDFPGVNYPWGITTNPFPWPSSLILVGIGSGAEARQGIPPVPARNITHQSDRWDIAPARNIEVNAAGQWLMFKYGGITAPHPILAGNVNWYDIRTNLRQIHIAYQSAHGLDWLAQNPPGEAPTGHNREAFFNRIVADGGVPGGYVRIILRSNDGPNPTRIVFDAHVTRVWKGFGKPDTIPNPNLRNAPFLSIAKANQTRRRYAGRPDYFAANGLSINEVRDYNLFGFKGKFVKYTEYYQTQAGAAFPSRRADRTTTEEIQDSPMPIYNQQYVRNSAGWIYIEWTLLEYTIPRAPETITDGTGMLYLVLDLQYSSVSQDALFPSPFLPVGNRFTTGVDSTVRPWVDIGIIFVTQEAQQGQPGIDAIPEIPPAPAIQGTGGRARVPGTPRKPPVWNHGIYGRPAVGPFEPAWARRISRSVSYQNERIFFLSTPGTPVLRIRQTYATRAEHLEPFLWFEDELGYAQQIVSISPDETGGPNPEMIFETECFLIGPQNFIAVPPNPAEPEDAEKVDDKGPRFAALPAQFINRWPRG